MIPEINHKITSAIDGASASGMITDEAVSEIYSDLRKLALTLLIYEPPGQSIQATDLVHEVYLRLAGDDLDWDNRGHFFASAARSMRQILVNRAIRKQRQKHGGAHKRLEFNDDALAGGPTDKHLIALDEALDRLEKIDPRKAEIVNLRYFGGLSVEQTARALSISPRTVKREWRFSRSWLYQEISDLDE